MAADRIALLLAHSGYATKQFRQREDGSEEKIDYDRAKTFSVVEPEIDGIADLAELLTYLQREHRWLAIRGRMRPGEDPNNVVRRLPAAAGATGSGSGLPCSSRSALARARRTVRSETRVSLAS
jgi:hypothetical protein